jgi:RNA polymerase sigma-70 factor, ECF subfamily
LSEHELSETDRLLARVEQGDRECLGRLLGLHRDYVKRVVELRMGEDLRGRVDPSDVVQETQLVVTRRIDDFLQRRPVAFRVWLRRKTLEQIVDTRRHHLAAKRSVRRQFHLTDASSLALAQQLMVSRPSQIARRKETAQLIRAAIEQMGETDREILLLRHIEELTNNEAAEALEIDPAAARKRHGRAIRRLGQLLADLDFSKG